MQPFIDTIMDHPYEDGPLLVLADWLMERGDPRGELLSFYPKIVETIKALPNSPETYHDSRISAIDQIMTDTQRRFFAALQARYTPIGDGKIVGDLHVNKSSQQCVTASLLSSMKLIPDKQLKEIKAVASKVAFDAWASWEILHAEAATAARTAAEDSTHLACVSTWAASVAEKQWASAYRWQYNLARWVMSSANLPIRIRQLLGK